MRRKALRAALVLALLTATVASASCAKATDTTSDGGAVPVTLETLTGNWETSTVEGPEGTVELKRPAVLKIHSDGSFVLDAGCNNIGGSFSLEADELRSTPVRSTRMACNEPISTFEFAASQIITEMTGAELPSEDTLVLEAPSGNLKFQRI